MKTEYPCASCGKPVYRTPATVVGRVFCSRECVRQKVTGEPSKRRKMVGPDHAKWKGGAYIKNGYRLLWRPEHPNAASNGYVYEHRLIMAEHLGRALTPQESVHHKNGDRLDNRVDNLETMSRREHGKIHAPEKAARGLWDNHGGGCSVCHTTEGQHYAKGMCFRCHSRLRMAECHRAGYVPPSRRKNGTS